MCRPSKVELVVFVVFQMAQAFSYFFQNFIETGGILISLFHSSSGAGLECRLKVDFLSVSLCLTHSYFAKLGGFEV